jgi:23S rRNA (adenine2503-C2)-methyltransferase
VYDTRMIHLLDLTPDELRDAMASLDEKPFRAKQIEEWIWKKRVVSIDEMTNLSQGLQDKLHHTACVLSGKGVAEVDSTDGCKKLLLEWPDGERTETVGIPDGDRLTVCVSTQVGCGVGCRFCASGLDGFVRNLTSGEIVEQLFHVAHAFDRSVTNVVFMGQGEPLANTTETLRSIRTMVDPDRLGISARKITVSTVGFPDGIRELAHEGLPVTLALSLHAATDELRETLIPTALRFGLGDILDAARDFYASRKREITLGYTLLGGINDDLASADHLAGLATRLRCNVNLIRYNDAPGLNFTSPHPDTIHIFAERLRKAGVNVTLRKSRGTDAQAACGQLRRNAKK